MLKIEILHERIKDRSYHISHIANDDTCIHIFITNI